MLQRTPLLLGCCEKHAVFHMYLEGFYGISQLLLLFRSIPITTTTTMTIAITVTVIVTIVINFGSSSSY